MTSVGGTKVSIISSPYFQSQKSIFSQPELLFSEIFKLLGGSFFQFSTDCSDCGRAGQDAENSTLLGGQVQPFGGCSDPRPKVVKVIFKPCTLIILRPGLFQGGKAEYW